MRNVGSSSVVEGTKAFLGTYDNEVVAVDLTAKRIAWRFRDPEREFPYYASPALSGTRVIVGGRDKAVHALEMASGKSAWKFVTRARVDSSAAIAGGRVFVGSSDGKFYVLDAQTGQKRWEYEVGEALTSSPTTMASLPTAGSVSRTASSSMLAATERRSMRDAAGTGASPSSSRVDMRMLTNTGPGGGPVASWKARRR